MWVIVDQETCLATLLFSFNSIATPICLYNYSFKENSSKIYLTPRLRIIILLVILELLLRERKLLKNVYCLNHYCPYHSLPKSFTGEITSHGI